MSATKKPNPGSPEAVKQGCKCAVIDNHYGKGMPYPEGPAWWINGDCPLHGLPEREESK